MDLAGLRILGDEQHLENSLRFYWQPLGASGVFRSKGRICLFIEASYNQDIPL